jgi:hypothetical protein
MSRAFGDWAGAQTGEQTADAENSATRGVINENKTDAGGKELFDSVVAEYDQLGWRRGKMLYDDRYAVFFQERDAFAYFSKLDDAINSAFLNNGSIWARMMAPDGTIIIFRRATLAEAYAVAFNSMNQQELTEFNSSRRDNFVYTIGHDIRHYWDRVSDFQMTTTASGENHCFAVRAGIFGF